MLYTCVHNFLMKMNTICKAKQINNLDPFAFYASIWRSGNIAPLILNLITRERRVVSFTWGSLYLTGKSPQYLFNRRLSGSQSQFTHFGEEVSLVPIRNQARIPWLANTQCSYHTDWANPTHNGFHTCNY